MALRPWEGVTLCLGTTRTGHRCGCREIEGLDFCLHHVPGELLEEAEALVGFRRCRHKSGCRQFAVAGSDPVRCKNHGCNRGSVGYKRAIMRRAEVRYALRYARFLAQRDA
jgi:hypothetical protein